MKLKDVLDIVVEISTQIRKARANVRYCEECSGRISQEDHYTKHSEAAFKLLDKLPQSLGASSSWNYKIHVKPEITLKIDGRGHVVMDVWDIDIH